MSAKIRFPRAVAVQVAREICDALTPVTERIIVAGSLRRKASEVGDVEILFIDKIITQQKPGDLFADERISLAEVAIGGLLEKGIITKRPNKLGAFTWGDKNKLAIHTATGVPLDLFHTREASWWNYLVCRTGSAEHNVKIASRAQELGWKWHPYGSGFTELATGKPRIATSEQDLFAFLQLPYLEPSER